MSLLQWVIVLPTGIIILGVIYGLVARAGFDPLGVDEL